MRRKIMTQAEATRRARKVLSRGHFANGQQNAYVYVDGERIDLYGMAGRKPSHGEMVSQLAQALYDAAGDSDA